MAPFCNLFMERPSYYYYYLSPFLRYDDLSVESRQFSLPHLCSTPNLKMFPLH